LLTVWDPATGKPVATPAGETGLIRSVAFAPDGKTLISAALQKQALVVWDTATWEVIRTVPVGARAVLSLNFAPEGKTLAVGTSATQSSDNALMLFDTATFDPRAVVTFELPVLTIAFSPDGRTLAASCVSPKAEALGQVFLCDPTSGERRRVLEQQVNAGRIAFAPDGKALAAGLIDGTIVLWDHATGARLQTIGGHETAITSLGYSPDGRTLATAARDGTLKLWGIGDHDL
jgi:WD40 repeat protein